MIEDGLVLRLISSIDVELGNSVFLDNDVVKPKTPNSGARPQPLIWPCFDVRVPGFPTARKCDKSLPKVLANVVALGPLFAALLLLLA